MKFRTQHDDTFVSQSFTPFVENYKMNDETHELQRIDDINIDEVVESSRSTCLSEMLKRFGVEQTVALSQTNTGQYADISDIDDCRDNISFSQQYTDKLKKRYNLDENLSVDETLQAVQDLSFAQNEKVAKLQAEIEKIKKGVDNNEKKTEPKSE